MISIGVDLGKAQDFTALAVVCRTETTIHHFQREWWQTRTERESSPAHLIHLERLPAGASFTEAVKRVKELATHPALGSGPRRVVVDATGLGSPVVEMLRGAKLGCELRAVVITGGSGQRQTCGSWYVAKSDLMTGLRTSMELQDLLIAARLPEKQILLKELTAFGGAGHDDTVLALALAVWGVRKGYTAR